MRRNPLLVVLSISALGLAVAALRVLPDQIAVEAARTGLLMVAVTDRVTGEGVEGVDVRLDPASGFATPKPKARGYVEARLPAGSYRVSLRSKGYRDTERSVTIEPGQRVLERVAMDPTAPVIVDAVTATRHLAPGSTVTIEAMVTVRDDSRVQSYHWTPGVDCAASRENRGRRRSGQDTRRKLDSIEVINGLDRREITVKLPRQTEFKKALLRRLTRDGNRLLDRWMVLGLTPSDIAEAGRIRLRVDVGFGEHTLCDTVDLQADLSAFATPNPGLSNVPVGEPVLLHGAEEGSYGYDWSLQTPNDSAARLYDADLRNPHFVPDLVGQYRVFEGEHLRLNLYAGEWRGALLQKRSATWPAWADERGCSCHFEGPFDSIFEAWAGSGHAEIFSQVLDTDPRNQEGCFVCHTVGFQGAGGKTGINRTPIYTAFRKDEVFWEPNMDPPSLRRATGNWAALLLRYPEVARFTNVQCDNCHGPTDSAAHNRSFTDSEKRDRTIAERVPERISLSSSVCAPCHEPPGENSYREWLEKSKHSSYRLAVETSTAEHAGRSSGMCATCHSAQGFLAKMRPQSDAPTAVPQLTPTTVHPVTCVVCHDPHSSGNSFHWATEKVPTRIARAPAGGRGLLCMRCHRNPVELGAHDDESREVLDSVAAPHAPQFDVLMGLSAFFVEVGTLRDQAQIEDTCVSCHMKRVPDEPDRGYPRGEVRHDFSAIRSDCNRCPDKELLKVELKKLKEAIEDALKAHIERSGGAAFETDDGNEINLLPGEEWHLRLRILEPKKRRMMAVEIEAEALDKWPTVALSRITLADSAMTRSRAGQVITKAAWNYFLAEQDGSFGAHNPSYVNEILASTHEEIGRLNTDVAARSP